MYKPAPPRLKKTDNVRSRTGCQSCRARRTKCDEKKPTCGTCVRLRRLCHSVKPQLRFRVITTSPPTPGCFEVEAQSSVPASVTGRCHPLRSLVADTTLLQSLQHTERDVLYTTYCEDRCFPALHPVFRKALLHSSRYPMLKDAILALSSCNFSRSAAELKAISASCLGAYRPNLVHQTRSYLYYSRAIKSFTSLNHQDCQRNLTISLMVVVIFAYVESSVGNFTGFDCHARWLSIFLDTLHQETGDAFVKSLLTAFMQSRFLVWWSRAYYKSLKRQQQLPRVPLPAILRSSICLPEERRVLVLSIMCESYRLNIKAALGHWSSTNIQVDTDRVSISLNAEASSLDEWLMSLPPSELPLTREPTEDSTSTNPNIPVYFHLHDAALNYAYYVLARIMQCTDVLHRLPMREPQILGQECAAAKPWVQLLFCIVQGSDMQTSVKQNPYTIGFSSLLLAAYLRCQDISLSTLIEEWLQALERLTPTEEGSFPIFQALGVVKAINRQRMMGHDVFAVSQSIDDIGGSKFSCYCGQMIRSLFVHGKIRSTGDLFTEFIPVEGQRPESDTTLSLSGTLI